MPELPEVETVRRGLAPALEGAVLSRILLRRADLRFAFPADFEKRLTGARIERLDRRGKYLLAPLSTGESLIMHLGMSGRFSVEAGETAASRPNGPGLLTSAIATRAAHDHVVFEIARPLRRRVIYNDPRRFGFMDLAPTAEIENARHFSAMGPEPLGDAFSPAGLSAALKARRGPIKTALLDQRVVAGLGNIYVCEALFKAGISPRRSARSVAGRRAERLHGAIIEVLRAAIEAGGSSLRDFAGADGALGYFQHRFEVYDREGRACPVCDNTVRRMVQSGRSTFFCSACQR